jgi:hypothetical protein
MWPVVYNSCEVCFWNIINIIKPKLENGREI